MAKRKAMSHKKAQDVRKEGHAAAREFAAILGLPRDYQNNPQAKKDVVDSNGDSHSVKSGAKRWQIFLYGKNRFETDNAFLSMNGIGQLIIKCINVFPKTFSQYTGNKLYYKKKLGKYMAALKEKFYEKRRVKTFWDKALFNGGEVDYLAVKYENKFHVFLNKEIVAAFGDNFEVDNSKARKKGDTESQKVLFKYKGVNVAELEIRNSSANHYREVLLVMNKDKALAFLFEKIKRTGTYKEKIVLYGKAAKKMVR